ncbi:MAG: ribokinase [Chloroflexota bacterium]|nr:ribokinase [Chloroflexota bacterium]
MKSPIKARPEPSLSAGNTGLGFDVLVVGSVNTDLVVPVPRLPQAGETVLGGDLQRIGGGKGANQAVAAARLGSSTAFLGCVGADGFGQARVAELESYGVAVGAVVNDPIRSTGAALILVDKSGENVIAVSPGANAELAPSHVKGAAALFAESSVLVCQLEVPLDTVQTALNLARDHDMTTILNAAPGNPKAIQLLAATDVLVVNRAEAEALTEHRVSSLDTARTTAEALRKSVRRAAVLTLGAEGCLVATSCEITHVPAWQVPAVDATAAGDAFVGALAAALAHGKTVTDAAPFATAAAAITVGRFGAQQSLPTGEEVVAFLRNPPVATPAGSHHDGRVGST